MTDQATHSDSHSVMTAELRERAELADELRGLLESFTGTLAPDETLGLVRKCVQTAQALLLDQPSDPSRTRILEGELTGLGPYGELGPFTGRLHAIGAEHAEVASSLVAGGRRVDARMRFGTVHQGPPGFVHGGVLAAVFDEVLGLAQSGFGRMTATLQMTYLVPTPIKADLLFTAQVVDIDGRKARVQGDVTHESTVCARAEALFVAPRVAAGT